jgi:HSP20 family protein
MAKTDVQVRTTDTIIDQVNQLERVISDRAYALFRDRHGIFGDPVTDWLSAERALIWKPTIEVRQRDSQVEILAALPGVNAKDVDVEVTPQDVLIKAQVNHEHTADEGTVQICEFSHGRAFRSVHLPASIDPNSVKAEYRNGMLRLTAAVAQVAAPRKVDITVA